MKIGQQKKSRYVIIIRDTKTKKYKSMVFDNAIKNKEELLNLIKNLLINYYKNNNQGRANLISLKKGINPSPLNY